MKRSRTNISSDDIDSCENNTRRTFYCEPARKRRRTKSIDYADISKKLEFLSKLTKPEENDNNDATNYDSEEESPFYNSGTSDKVYMKDNHIYFRTAVNMDSVNKLTKLINEANEKYETAKSSKIFASAVIEPKPIYLHISSYGGSVHAGLIAYDAIKNSPVPIYTVVEGYACSMGSIMSVAGAKRFMTEHSTILIHQISGGASGTFAQMEEAHENHKLIMNQLIDIYFTNCGGKMKKKDIREALKHDYYWTYKECQKRGLVDDLYKGVVEKNNKQ